ncbi:MAG: tol-pal system protein YbgF [Gammaproteobacteria bacterium RIFOXYB2_FULL_38_6]|nr:MAG: tol-pal system protein YbgF [Gammaproteobacteria bacterium RIFOXYB2_FULL_38_6]
MHFQKIIFAGLVIIGFSFSMTIFADAPVIDATAGNQAVAVGDSSSASANTNANATTDTTPTVQTQLVNTNDDANDNGTNNNVNNSTDTQQIAQQVNNLVQMNLPQQINDLQEQIQQLQGQLQVQQHDIKLLNMQQRSFYQDLDQRINQVSALNSNTNSSSANTTSSTNSASVTTPAITSIHTATAKKTMQQSNAKLTESSEYEHAFELIAKKQYDPAAKALNQYLNDYPTGQFVANTHYWLGEIYLLQDKLSQALQEFQTVINHYPDSSKVSDAKLKLAILHLHQGKTEQAVNELNQIKKQYPNTTASQLAAIQLQQINNNSAAVSSSNVGNGEYGKGKK